MSSARSLDDWLRSLESAHTRSIDLGLDRVNQVYQHLPQLSERTTVVTVAGTNGKGSCVATLAAMAKAAGVRYGAYTSPHVQHFRERLNIDGALLPDGDWCACFELVEQARARADVSLTYFEFTTLAAFVLLSEYDVELALLEVGLGGRLDAVNIIDADITVITQIDIDHTEYLGNTIEAIAAEKAGILRGEVPAVIASPNPPKSIGTIAKQVGAPLYMLGRDFAWQDDTFQWSVRTKNGDSYSIGCTAAPKLHPHSVAAAIAVWQLRYGLDSSPPEYRQRIAEAASAATVTGRWQCVDDIAGKRVILDVGHNPAAANHLAKKINDMDTSGTIRVVLGMCADKDMSSFVQEILPSVHEWYPVRTSDPRSAEVTALTEVLQACDANVAQVDNTEGIEPTLKSALANTQAGDVLLICGSFAVVGDSLDALELSRSASQHAAHETTPMTLRI